MRIFEGWYLETRSTWTQKLVVWGQVYVHGSWVLSWTSQLALAWKTTKFLFPKSNSCQQSVGFCASSWHFPQALQFTSIIVQWIGFTERRRKPRKQKKKYRKLFDKWSALLIPKLNLNHRLHYSACLVPIYLANHPHYPTNLSANLPQLNGNKNTPERKMQKNKQNSPWSSSWSSSWSSFEMMTIGHHMVIISKWCPWSSFDDHDSHGLWYGHHFQNDDHGRYFLNHFMQGGRPCTKTAWWPWSSFSEWRPWLPYQNDHGKIEDDHEMMTTKNDDHGWWPWPKNMPAWSVCVQKTENGNKNLPSGNSSKHSTTI